MTMSLDKITPVDIEGTETLFISVWRSSGNGSWLIINKQFTLAIHKIGRGQARNTKFEVNCIYKYKY